MPNWTQDQIAAIATTDCDLLVSASAGTGKTAVLVERIIRIALHPAAPVDLDRFLVVTFTEAAAAEMREKIAEALRRRLAEHPDDEKLRRQMLLLDAAQISTIHAFCNRLLRRHFHRIGLDPEFSILDAEDAALLQTETIDALFEKTFEDADASGRAPAISPQVFLDWMDGFGGANPAIEARRQLLALHHFLRSLDAPEQWIAEARAAYPLDDEGHGVLLPFEKHRWFPAWKKAFTFALEHLDAALKRAATDAAIIEPQYNEWITPFSEMAQTSRTALKCANWDAAIRAIQEFQPARMPSIRNKSDSCERLKHQLDVVKNDLFQKTLRGDLAALTPQQAARSHADAAPQVHLLLNLAERFHDAYTKAKRSRVSLDFNDLEQLCLKLLRDPELPEQPSDIALLCRSEFEYILVDEYQDINHVQDAILSFVSRSSHAGETANFFAVGDVKQCIYAFRLAAPEIFLAKYDASSPLMQTTPASQEDKRRGRVNLKQNFRSHPAVLQAVNHLFHRVMMRETAGFDYDTETALIPGAEFPGTPRDSVPVELHLLESASWEEEAPDSENSDAPGAPEVSLGEWSGMEREAFLTGQMILNMLGKQGRDPDKAVRVFDPAAAGVSPNHPESAMRPATFRDIVILLRAACGWAETFASILQNMGIPVFTNAGGGLLAAPEVRDILNLLHLIDNPLQDVPLAAVLRSPLENWTDTEIFEIRRVKTDGFFHEAFRASARAADLAGPVSPVASKAAAFLERLNRWRTRARCEPLADLVAAIYDETGYPLYVAGLDDGEIRRANLARLYRIACRFDHFSRQGLSRFLRFIEQLQEEEGDYGAASPLGEGQDVVRILSIHKSKGLEFPIVFLPGLGKRFNLQDLARPVLFSRENGIGTKITDLQRAVRYPAPAHRALSVEKRRESLAEELRILYVAMTRARERLVMMGAVKKLKEVIANRRIDVKIKRLDTRRVLAALCPLDWIVPSVTEYLDETAKPRAQSVSDSEPQPAYRCFLYSQEEVRAWSQTGAAPAPSSAPNNQQTPESETALSSRLDALCERLRWRYSHESLTGCPARISAMELKRRWSIDREGDERVREPFRETTAVRFLTSTEPAVSAVPGTERGLWTHLVLQHFDLLKPLDYAGISAQIDGMMDRGILTEAQRSHIDLAALEAFFASGLGRRLLAVPPDRVWRETPFWFGLTPSEAGMPELAADDETERIRVQGVMDCLFEEDNGGLILVDYKTDALSPEMVGARTAHYLPQMRIYAKAIERISGKPPAEIWIYYLFLSHAEKIAIGKHP